MDRFGVRWSVDGYDFLWLILEIVDERKAVVQWREVRLGGEQFMTGMETGGRMNQVGPYMAPLNMPRGKMQYPPMPNHKMQANGQHPLF
jgi:hypothetical protein